MNNIKRFVVLFLFLTPFFIKGQTISEEEEVFNKLDNEGLKNGKWTEYILIKEFPDSLKCNINYVKGVKDGNFNCFHKNEVRAIYGKYTNGVEDGIWSYQKENGLEFYRIEYNNGEIIEKEYFEYIFKEKAPEVSKITHKDKDDNIKKIDYFKDYILIDTEYPR